VAGRALAPLIAATAVATVALPAAAAAAAAAPYQVRMCTPSSPGHDFQIVNEAPTRLAHTDSCGSTGGVRLWARPGAPAGSRHTITATAHAPPGTEFTGWDASFHDLSLNGARAEARACPDPLCRDHERVYEGRDNWGWPAPVSWRAGSTPALALQWLLSCPQSGCGADRPAAIEMLSPLIALADREAPAAPALRLPPWPLRGRQRLAYLAADRGGGVARVIPELDGTELPGAELCTRVPDPVAGPVWDRLQPCPTAHAGRLALDLRGARPGRHSLRLIAEDAAGQRTAGAPQPIRVGRGRHAFVIRAGFPLRVRTRTGRRVIRLVPRLRVRAGRRITVSGLLRTPEGRPLPGRRVRLSAKPRFVPGRRTLAATATTGARGRFTLRVRASRSLALHVTHPGAAPRRLDLAVPARSTLRVSRAAVPPAGSVLFRGRLLEGHLPRLGKLVEMQAFFRGSWRTFATTRSDRRGRWRVPYRFGATAGPLRYRFRARIPVEYGYPFHTGTSALVSVLVSAP
jgi:hypothetical protein